MPYSKFINGFWLTSAASIDKRLLLTKAEMLEVSNGRIYLVPDVYFALCIDDGKFYIYNINNSIDTETGKYRQVCEEDIEAIINRLNITETNINALTNDKQDTLTVTDGLVLSGSTLSINFDTVAKTTDLNSLYKQINIDDEQLCIKSQISNLASGVSSLSTDVSNLSASKQDVLTVSTGLLLSGSTLSINFDNVAKTADLNSLYKQVNVDDDKLCLVSQINNLASGMSNLSLNKVDKNGTDRLMTEDEATKLAGIEANANKFPSLDASVDGNYFLQATVSNGTITYSWAKITESEE